MVFREALKTGAFGVSCALIAFSSVIASCSARDPVRTESPPAVSAEELERHVGYLASDDLFGREAGSEGIRLAEEYIAAEFLAAGLTPLPGEDDLFLEFTIYRRGFDPGRSILGFEVGGREIEAKPGQGFRPFDFSDEGGVRAPVVFAGYGIRAPEYGYDDYAGLDVEGKIVLVFRHEPNENDPASPFNGTSHTRHALFLTKAKLARSLGAAALVLVTDPLNHGEEEDLRFPDGYSLSDSFGRTGDVVAGLAAVHASIPLIRDVLSGSGTDLSDLQSAVDGGARPSDLAFPEVTAEVIVEMLPNIEPVPVRNVAAYLSAGPPDGAGAKAVVVGAHHDHIGAFAGEGDTIYNGADDNASGTAVVLELARIFSQCGGCNERPMIFMTFSAEEMGLFGSRVLFEERIIDPETIEFMVNFDMVGRNPDGSVEAEGADKLPAVMKIIEETAASFPSLRLSFPAEEVTASDHYPFRRAGIPSIFMSTGLHEDYHGVDDESDAIDYERMAEITEMTFRLLDTLYETMGD